jgi:hypothetical protein
MKLVDISETKTEHLKGKSNEDKKANSNSKYIRDLYRGSHVFKKGYQPETSIVNNEKSDLLAGSHSILNRCRHNFSRLLNVRGVHNRNTYFRATGV